jgi:hypothetical protein
MAKLNELSGKNGTEGELDELFRERGLGVSDEGNDEGEEESGVVKDFVHRESFLLGKKKYYKYFAAGEIRGREVQVDFYPKAGKDDKRGYLLLDIVFDGRKTVDFKVKKLRVERNGKKSWVYSFEIFSDVIDEVTGEVERFGVDVVPATQSNRELLALLLRRRGVLIDA